MTAASLRHLCRIRRRVYLERAEPRLATPKFFADELAFGPLIEPVPGSNFPARIF
jgi:hypothetical protein